MSSRMRMREDEKPLSISYTASVPGRRASHHSPSVAEDQQAGIQGCGMADDFQYDVFLSHSSKDKPVVREVAERLRGDGLRVWFDEWEIQPGDSIPAKIEEGLEHSRVLVLCMSAHAFGSDWSQLESQTFRFRDPLNKQRRFIPLRLDDAPINETLLPFLYISWHSEDLEQEYPKILNACRDDLPVASKGPRPRALEPESLLRAGKSASWVSLSEDGKIGITGSADLFMRVWDLESAAPVSSLRAHVKALHSVRLAANGRRAVSSSRDGTIKTWDLDILRCLSTIRHYTLRASISGNGEVVVSGGGSEDNPSVA